MSINEKAIEVAMGTFLHDWIGSASEVYVRLCEDRHKHWHEIDYATVWEAMENYSVADVQAFISTLYDSIVTCIREDKPCL